MKNRISAASALFLALLGLLLWAAAVRAADPEVQFREAQRLLMGTNGVCLVAIRDTNTTTDVTTYAPRFTGQVLFGRVGGSNAIWLATGSTTNGWTKVNQNP